MRPVIIICLSTILLSAFNQDEHAGQGPSDRAIHLPDMATAHTSVVHLKASKVHWAGTMLGIKTHTGTLNFTSGVFTTKGLSVQSGEFVVDMPSLATTDTNYAPDGSKQGTRSNLISHLMSPDFFAADSFPTASFKINSTAGNTATGDLTVRGQTHAETVTDIVVTKEGGAVRASGKLIFDRQKYGVAWSIGSADFVLSDDIELNIELVGKSAQ